MPDETIIRPYACLSSNLKVAERKLLPDVCEKLGGNAASEDRGENADGRIVRLEHAVAEAVAHDQLALGHVHFLREIPRLVLDGIHADIGTHLVVRFGTRKRDQRFGKGALDPAGFGAAAIEYLDGRRGEYLFIIFGQFLIIDLLGLVLGAHLSVA